MGMFDSMKDKAGDQIDQGTDFAKEQVENFGNDNEDEQS